MLNKEALQYLDQMSQRGSEIKTNQYGQEISPVQQFVIEQPTVKPFGVSTLQAVVDYLISDPDSSVDKILHIVSPEKIGLYGVTNQDNRRDCFITAEATLPHFVFDQWYDLQTMNIKLQAGFAPTEEAAMLKRILGNVMDEKVRNTSDDGVSQSIVTRQSMTTGTEEQVPNRISLKPFRTFVELPSQPESEFILRLESVHGEIRAKLVEADGGAWKIEAVASIKKYIEDKLNDHDITEEHTILDRLTILS